MASPGKLTINARAAVDAAARARSSHVVVPADVLWALSRAGKRTTAQLALDDLGLRLPEGRTERSESGGKRRLGRETRRLLHVAEAEALQLGHNYIGTEHLLLGLIRTDEGGIAGRLRDAGVTIECVRESVVRVLERLTAARRP